VTTAIVSETLASILQRADELAELVVIYPVNEPQRSPARLLIKVFFLLMLQLKKIGVIAVALVAIKRYYGCSCSE